MTEAVAPIDGMKIDARYTLVEKLGAGGQGEVWRAHDGTCGIDVALKVVNGGNRGGAAWSALEHEYAIASRLDHPSILKVFAPHRAGDTLVLPMELATGGDLRRLRGGGFLEIIPVLLEIAQALEHAHERGVVHRDLKPGNVLFDARGRARLADFGVAEAALSSNEAASSAVTRETNKHGFSPFTASPAQLRGEPPTAADDIYGLGALAYELLSGYPPYYPHFDKKRAIEERVPELVPTRQIPPLLGTLVMHMLAKDPKRRPRTMREVIDELDAALNDTLTFDFEKASQGNPTAALGAASNLLPASNPRAPAQSTPGLSASNAALAASIRDNATINLPPLSAGDRAAASYGTETSQRADWTHNSGRDRRSNSDRRARPRDEPGPLRIREPKLLSGVDNPAHSSSNTRTGLDSPATSAASSRPVVPSRPIPTSGDDTIVLRPEGSVKENASPDVRNPGTPTQRTGADALARIDAAIERAAASTATAVLPPKGRMWQTGFSAEATRERPAHYDPDATIILPMIGQPKPTGSMATPPRAKKATRSATPIQQVPPAAQQPKPASDQSQSARPAPAHGSSHNLGFPVPASVPAASSPMSVNSSAMHGTWPAIPLDGLPRVARLKPIKVRRWPWVLLGLLAGAAAVVYFLLPRFDTDSLPAKVSALIAPVQSALAPSQPAVASAAQSSTSQAPTASADVPPAPTTQSGAAASPAAVATTAPNFDAGDQQRLRGLRQRFDNRLAMLESRGAGAWGGRDFALAKTQAAEGVGAQDAGNMRMAQERLTTAMKLLDGVESRAPEALSAQIVAGEQAMGTGQQEVAGQAFGLARRIDPNDRRATDGQRRAQSLNGVLPLLADAQNAESGREFARAAQDYSQALSLDPANETAKAGQARANAAFGDDSYAQAVGSGYAALGAGRLDEAHKAFVKARALKPTGVEASDGLRRVGAALTARGFAAIRQRAIGLEAQERWDEAEKSYEDVLRADSSLAFAQEGKARSISRADLGVRLQQYIDRPDRLAAPGVKDDVRALLQTAQAQSPSGPVLRSQIARLQALLPGVDRPVHLSLLSDNSTRVVIPNVGSLGAFSRRDIQLRPGKYIVVGTRNGFRDVRREITVAPGQDAQTIKVTCSEPI